MLPLPVLTDRVVAFDLEGRGYADPDRGRMVAFALVEFVGGRPTGQVLHSLVNPRATISRYAAGIHGITAEQVAQAPGFAELAPAILAFIGDDLLVGHDAENDVRMLSHDLRVAGLAPLDPRRAICTQRLARHLKVGHALSLDNLATALGLAPRRPGVPHDALTDARLAGEAWTRLAALPGYAAIPGYSVRPSAVAAARKVSCALEDDGATLAFFLADGTRLTVPAPVLAPGQRLEVHERQILLRGPDGRPVSTYGVRQGEIQAHQVVPQAKRQRGPVAPVAVDPEVEAEAAPAP